MRNIPLPFLSEETLNQITRSRENRSAEPSAAAPRSWKDRAKSWFQNRFEALLECDGPNSIANLERILGSSRQPKL